MTGLNLISKQYRTALRYINILPEINIFTKSRLSIQLNSKILGKNQINFTAEIPYERGASNLKLVNLAEAVFEEHIIKGSIVDIDTVVELDKCPNFKEAIEYAHTEEKRLFFTLLEREFLSSLNPVYEEV